MYTIHFDNSILSNRKGNQFLWRKCFFFFVPGRKQNKIQSREKFFYLHENHFIINASKVKQIPVNMCIDLVFSFVEKGKPRERERDNRNLKWTIKRPNKQIKSTE